MSDVGVQELPCVMSLEADFGMGKTHFATRFCEHLKRNEMDAVQAGPGYDDAYLQKFITTERRMPSLSEENYKKAAEELLPKLGLERAFEGGVLCEEADVFNGFPMLRKKLASYAFKAGLSLRALRHICQELICFLNSYKHPLHCEYFAWGLCNKALKGAKKLELDESHPFRKNIVLDDFRGKIDLLHKYSVDIKSPFDSYDRRNKGQSLSSTYFSLFQKDFPYPNLTYEKAFRIIDEMEENRGQGWRIEVYERFERDIIPFKAKIKAYQRLYGSDDNDQETKAHYDGLIDDLLNRFEEGI